MNELAERIAEKMIELHGLGDKLQILFLPNVTSEINRIAKRER